MNRSVISLYISFCHGLIDLDLSFFPVSTNFPIRDFALSGLIVLPSDNDFFSIRQLSQRAAYDFNSPSMSWAADLYGQRKKMRRNVMRYVAAFFNLKSIVKQI